MTYYYISIIFCDQLLDIAMISDRWHTKTIYKYKLMVTIFNIDSFCMILK